MLSLDKIHKWAGGGMVDTLVLGTSAKAWEFESLHAQLTEDNTCYPPLICVLSMTRNSLWSSSGFADGMNKENSG